MLDRREFLALGAVGAVSLAGVRALPKPAGGFSRNYAPHLGMFPGHAGSDPIDQIKFFADEGFRFVEDGGLRAKSPRLQARMGDELARRGMSLALFVGFADFGRASFASGCSDLRRGVLRDIRSAVDTARRVGGRSLAIIPGKIASNVPPGIQRRHAIDTLQACADVCEPYGVRLLLEPMDQGADSRLFLRTITQTADVCRAVGHPACRLLFDVHHQAACGSAGGPAITAGQSEDLCRLLVETSDVLGYVQLADFPGRKEPGTGEIDFPQLFATLDAIGYRGALGMEHGKSRPGREGERAVIEAYRALECGSVPLGRPLLPRAAS